MATPVNSFYGPIHVAVTWGAQRGIVDIDLSAVAYTADGNHIDACYFKKTSALAGAISSTGDNKTGFGYQMDDEGIYVHPAMLPPEVHFIFFIVNVQTQGRTFQGTGTGVRFADGNQPNGRCVGTLSLDACACEGVLAGVLIRSPPHVYPPGWSLHQTAAYPQAQGIGRDFNESQPLIEGYLRSSVPPELLANRPPNNPMEQCDLSKNDSYIMHPSVRAVQMGLGWNTTCDLDAHAFVLDEYYQKLTHVYRGRLHERGISHSGNDTRGYGDPNLPDENITVNLDALTPQAKHIVFFVNIRQGEERTRMVPNAEGQMVEQRYREPRPNNFANIPMTFCRLVDCNNGQVMCYYPLSQDATPGYTRLMCCITRFQGNMWSLAPLGTAIAGDPQNSEFARRSLIHATRPDLTRPVTIRFGPINGRDMVAKDKGGVSDPFFSVKWYDGDTTVKCDKIKKTVNPDWNQPELLYWKGPLVDLLDRVSAKLDVYDYDKWGLNDFMGRAYLHIKEIIGTRGRGVQQKTLTLGQKHEGDDKEVSGTITVQWVCEPSR